MQYIYIYIYIYIYMCVCKLIAELYVYGRTNLFKKLKDVRALLSGTLQTITPEKRLKMGCLNWENMWGMIRKKKRGTLCHANV